MFAQFTNKNDNTTGSIGVGLLNESKNAIFDISNQFSSIDQLIASGTKSSDINTQNCKLHNISDIQFLSPITTPSKIICVGKNYIDHALESGEGVPKEPLIFNKFQSAITGHNCQIKLPKIGATVDWEGELAVIIGKSGYQIKKENALDHVAGYTVANDVSARDWQKKRNGGQWLIGKSFDTFCPLGPYYVEKHLIENVQNLNISTKVNDKIMQNSNTKHMAFPVDVIIEWVSQFSTLNVGDVILTGTPDGVGAWRKPPIFLKNGDIVEVSVENVGILKNFVVDE